jgi:transcriptional regulator with XRE-family HTH domain
MVTNSVDSNKITLLKAVRELRENRGLSERQFALSIGIDPSTWSYIVSGGNNPGSKVLSGITRVYPELNTVVLNYMQKAGNRC